MMKDLEKVLVTEAGITEIINRVSARIEKDYKGKNLVMIGILKGGAPFMMDLIKKINLPLIIDFIRVESYFGGTTQGELVFRKDLSLIHIFKAKMLSGTIKNEYSSIELGTSNNTVKDEHTVNSTSTVEKTINCSIDVYKRQLSHRGMRRFELPTPSPPD